MSEIFSYISQDNIYIVDDYTNHEDLLYNFQNIHFRIEFCPNFYNFYSPVALKDKKILNISNKLFSFLIYKYKHFVGSPLANQVVSTYNNLLNNHNFIYVNEPVFQFIDYESISGTGHSYDLMFYLLFIYKQNNLTSKLLVVNSNNKYYNKTLNLIKKYYNIEYYYVDTDKNYVFENYSCTRTYQNIFFDKVKEFVNTTLIEPIINKYKNFESFKIISKIKYTNINNTNRCHDSFDLTQDFVDYLKINNICDLNFIEDEEYKIYLLNKAENIIINEGSSYYINICYYIKEHLNQNIYVIFHKNNSPDLWMFKNIHNKIYQCMPNYFCGELVDQVYNKINFYGNIISNIDSLFDVKKAIQNILFN
jgi:hypothetical protein